MIGTFMAVLDSTIVNVGLPKIMAAFGVGLDKIEWVITAYMLALAVILPTAGWFADKFGYKRVYFMGLFTFTVGSFLCGISGNENILIFSRVIQGLGAGCLMPVGMAIVTREFPPQQRGIALGFWAISAAASVSFGPLIGGYLVDNFSWSLIFDVNVPFGILAMLVTIVIQKEFINKHVKAFDVIGFISVSIFLPFLLYALTEGSAQSNTQGWTAPYIIICFAIAIVSLAVFITVELTVDHPLMDLRLLMNRNFGISNLILFIFSLGMFGSTFLLPLFLQNSLGYTAIQSGAVFLPVGIIQGALSPIAGGIADKTNAKVPVILGLVLLSLSFFLNAQLSYLSEHWFIMLSLYIRGFAMGIIFTPLNAISFLEVSREKMAQASSLNNVVRQIAGSLGVAVFATLLSTRVAYHTQVYGGAMEFNSPEYKEVTQDVSQYIQTNAGSSQAAAIKQTQTVISSHVSKQAYIQAIDDDFLLASGITLLGAIPVFFLHGRKKVERLKVERAKHENKKQIGNA
jgi:DHA2 family multidrug resistance protein